MIAASMYDRWLTKHRSTVAARIRRLNPYPPEEGVVLRGWHPKEPRRIGFDWSLIGKRQFIDRFGRRAWEAMPNGIKYKYGRRQYVTRVSVEDCDWMIYTGEAEARLRTRAIFTTLRYANDPRGCPVEYITVN